MKKRPGLAHFKKTNIFLHVKRHLKSTAKRTSSHLGTKPSSPAKFHLQFSTKRWKARKRAVRGKKKRKQ